MPPSDVECLPPGISVVIPCYRSQATLEPLVQRLIPVVNQLAAERSGGAEVLLVVDGSPDGTWHVASSLAGKYPDVVRAILLMRNYGQHNALLAGIDRARFDVLVTMDDDLQHLPEELPELVAGLADGDVDVVYGVADVEEHGLVRSLASRSVKRALELAGVPNVRDVSAFRAFRTPLRAGFTDVADAFASVDVFLSWTTTGVRRHRVRMDRRSKGRSSYSPTALVRHAFNMITGYSEAPLRLVLWLGVGLALLGAALLSYVLGSYFLGRTQLAGFTTLAAVSALFSGAQMLSLGILGEYLGRLHFRSMHKPTYLVRTELGGNSS